MTKSLAILDVVPSDAFLVDRRLFKFIVKDIRRFESGRLTVAETPFWFWFFFFSVLKTTVSYNSVSGLRIVLTSANWNLVRMTLNHRLLATDEIPLFIGLPARLPIGAAMEPIWRQWRYR